MCGAWQQSILSGQPSSAASDHPGRHCLFDADVAEHAGTPLFDQYRAFRVLHVVQREFYRAYLVAPAAIRTGVSCLHGVLIISSGWRGSKAQNGPQSMVRSPQSIVRRRPAHGSESPLWPIVTIPGAVWRPTRAGGDAKDVPVTCLDKYEIMCRIEFVLKMLPRNSGLF